MTGGASDYTGDPAISSTCLSTLGNLRTLLFGATGNLLYQFACYLVVGGLVTNYCLSRLWVFDQRTMANVKVEFLVFGVIGIVGLGLNEVIIWFVREKIHSHYMVAKAISVGIVLIWNFGARKSMTFR